LTPIQDLLHRIQWDPEFAGSAVVIGYYDRVSRGIVRVPFKRVRFATGVHFVLETIEDDGSTHSVPFHRIREVWRDGKLIWQRDGTPAAVPDQRAGSDANPSRPKPR
jgi:uncharacterized protein (UPF0248 family)